AGAVSGATWSVPCERRRKMPRILPKRRGGASSARPPDEVLLFGVEGEGGGRGGGGGRGAGGGGGGVTGVSRAVHAFALWRTAPAEVPGLGPSRPGHSINQSALRPGRSVAARLAELALYFDRRQGGS